MNKNYKLIGSIILALGILLIGLYFVFGSDNESSYTIIFDSDGGTSVASQKVKKGDKVTKPEDPTKENYLFVEWQLNGVQYIFDTSVLEDMTLKALWKTAVNYTIKVNLEGNDYSIEVSEGDVLNIDSFGMPIKDGYIIKLYNGEEEFDLSTPITSNLELTAKYNEAVMYTVKFDSDGGNKIDDVKIQEGELVTKPEVTKSGYELEGWYNGDNLFDFTTPITSNITLKARWLDKDKINVIFMVDNNVYKTVSIKENTKITKPANPTKEGYKFIEWQLNGTAFDFGTEITSETTLNARFEEIEYKLVSFDSDGGTEVESQKVEIGTKASKPTNPTKEGYVFKEWQLNDKTYDFNSIVEVDLALKASWEKEKAKFTVTFDSDGGTEVESQTIIDGERAARPVDPTKEGYEFKEWQLNKGTFDFTAPITGDITLVAYYEIAPTATPVPTESPIATNTPEVKKTMVCKGTITDNNENVNATVTANFDNDGKLTDMDVVYDFGKKDVTTEWCTVLKEYETKFQGVNVTCADAKITVKGFVNVIDEEEGSMAGKTKEEFKQVMAKENIICE